MQYTWQFSHPDTWTPLADHPVCKDNDDYLKTMAAAGYHQQLPVGGEGEVGCMEIWQASHPEASPYAFIVDVKLPDWTMATVCMATIPDLLAYIARYGAISFVSAIAEIRSLLERIHHHLKD